VCWCQNEGVCSCVCAHSGVWACASVQEALGDLSPGEPHDLQLRIGGFAVADDRTVGDFLNTRHNSVVGVSVSRVDDPPLPPAPAADALEVPAAFRGIPQALIVRPEDATLVKWLGVGGNGDVYLAQLRVPGQEGPTPCAVKVRVAMCRCGAPSCTWVPVVIGWCM
jgi:hypothetical protein